MEFLESTNENWPSQVILDGNVVGTIRVGQFGTGNSDVPQNSWGNDWAVGQRPDGSTQYFETSPNEKNRYYSNVSATDLALNFIREG